MARKEPFEAEYSHHRGRGSRVLGGGYWSGYWGGGYWGGDRTGMPGEDGDHMGVQFGDFDDGGEGGGGEGGGGET